MAFNRQTNYTKRPHIRSNRPETSTDPLSKVLSLFKPESYISGAFPSPATWPSTLASTPSVAFMLNTRWSRDVFRKAPPSWNERAAGPLFDSVENLLQKTSETRVFLDVAKQVTFPAVTSFKAFEGRSHYICGEPAWEEVAEFAAGWLEQQGIVETVTFSRQHLAGGPVVNRM
jgi:hypothetical protein